MVTIENTMTIKPESAKELIKALVEKQTGKKVKNIHFRVGATSTDYYDRAISYGLDSIEIEFEPEKLELKVD